MRPINEIIVHCTATHADWWEGKPTSAKVAEVRRWHLARGWSDIGYHYLIDRDGTVATGRPLDRTGAHVKGKNTGSIGISLFGGHGSSENDAFGEHFTAAQDKALRDLIAQLQARFGKVKVSGHNEYSAKACPGFKVGPWLANKAARSMAGSTTLQAAGVTGASIVTAAGTAIAGLDGTAQLVVIGALALAALATAWIARERIKKWAKGVR